MEENPLPVEISDIADLLNAAAAAFAGEREFLYVLGGRPLRFVYSLSCDSATMLEVRQKAMQLAQLTAPPPPWVPYWGTGLSLDVAMRIAWVEKCGVTLGGNRLTTLDCLKLAKGAGPLFVLLTDQIAADVTGIAGQAEEEAIHELGEDSTATSSGPPS